MAISKKALVIHESEGERVPDICGIAIGLINKKSSYPINLSIATIIIEPGKSSSRHFHKVTEEIYYIIDGLAFIEIGNDGFHLKLGHAVLIPINEIHQITNIGENQLRFLAIDSPGYDTSDIFLP